MRRLPSLRSYLVVLVLVSSVPLMLLAGGLIIVLSWHYRETTAENLIRTARAMSDAVDREFSDSVASLEVLASSPLLDPGDHRGFHQRLVAVSESLGWTEATVEVTPRWP